MRLAEKDRWLEGPGFVPPTPTANGVLRSYNVVHIVDARGGSAAVTEVVYHIGGAALEYTECDTDIDATSAVFKMANPRPSADPAGPSQWEAAPSMYRQRVEANTVQTLDGSFVTIGGVGEDDAGVVTAWLTVERFRPPEIFTTGNTSSWTCLDRMTEPREYHSTAFLLPPDGRIGAAGGRDYCLNSCPLTENVDEGIHSVEIYSPWYFFSGPRPEITFVETHEPGADKATIIVQAMIGGTQGGEFRVAFLRPAAVTHAWDFNQRYIMLPVSAWSDLGGGVKQFVVTLPWNNLIAPPGYYMMTLVDSSGRPSNIEWIKVPNFP
jgi:hypothetical protein